MHAEIKQTKDGSPTVYLPHLDEHYHSIHGAYTESMHVFILNGLKEKQKETISELKILEVGMGTGLNVLLTLQHSGEKKILYTALEPFPLEEKILQHIHFQVPDSEYLFSKIHQSDFTAEIPLSSHFTFLKIIQRLEEFEPEKKYDLIFFDAFSPKVQPEVWCLENFEKLFAATSNRGILVTYSSKGEVRRTLLQAGFKVEKLPGPPGKREMLRAKKNNY